MKKKLELRPTRQFGLYIAKPSRLQAKSRIAEGRRLERPGYQTRTRTLIGKRLDLSSAEGTKLCPACIAKRIDEVIRYSFILHRESGMANR